MLTFDRQLPEKLRYQEVDFVIDYARFEQPGYSSTEIFSDELVVVTAANHPRIGSQISQAEFMAEKHATLSKVNGVRSFYERVYTGDFEFQASYHGTSLSNILYVVGQSELVTVVPRWLIDSVPNRANYKVMPYPYADNEVAGYLSWHESSEKDKGHIWMRESTDANLWRDTCCKSISSMPKSLGYKESAASICLEAAFFLCLIFMA